MLDSLRIKNVAVIDEAQIELGEGLNILTGETGAGKSIIIDSVNLILGERSNKDIVRHGKDRASISALFSSCPDDAVELAKNAGADTDGGEILLSRDITVEGKSSAKISGEISTGAYLKSIGRCLVNIHGQHDSQLLLDSSKHIDFLDAFSGSDLDSLKSEYSSYYSQYRQACLEIKKAAENEQERAARADYLAYATNEIEECGFYEGEEGELSEEEALLANAMDIISSLSSAYEAVYGGEYNSYDALSSALKEIEKTSSFSDDLSSIYDRAADIKENLNDLALELRRLRDGSECDPERLSEVQQRLSVISDMKRKYSVPTLEALLEKHEKMKDELLFLTDGEKSLDALEKKRDEAYKNAFDLSVKMTHIRLKAADALEEQVVSELCDLDMDKAKFTVGFNKTDDLSENGADEVEFLISANPGEPVKPLSKTASGGELSRIMLALKTVLADADSVPTLIFDEIDTGVSGRAAAKIAEKLYNISKKKQVICITHLAQIASMATNHYLIEKTTSSESASTSVRLLSEAERLDELTRIISGNIKTDSAKSYAAELLKNAAEFKSRK